MNAEEEGARSSFRVAFLETCVSYSDIGAGRENKTPPPMHRVRCLGYLGRHTEGGETARTAVSFFLRLPSDRFLSFHSTQSQTRRRLLFFATRPRGKSSARHQDGITRLSIEREHYITLHPKISREIFGVHILPYMYMRYARPRKHTKESTAEVKCQRPKDAADFVQPAKQAFSCRPLDRVRVRRACQGPTGLRRDSTAAEAKASKPAGEATPQIATGDSTCPAGFRARAKRSLPTAFA